MQPSGFAINLTSDQPEKLLEFYRDVVGLPKNPDMGEGAFTAAGGTIFVDGHSDTKGAANLGTTSNGSPEDPARLSQQGATTQEWPAPDELDRKLRRHFLDLLAQMDEAALAAYFATPEGQQARTALEDFTANHPSGRSNQKADGILNRVPGGANEAPPGRR